MVKNSLSLKRYDVLIILFIIILASFDLFRGYIENAAVNSFFALKEVLLLFLFGLFVSKTHHTYISRSFLLVAFTFIIYCFLNIRNDGGILLFFIFYKYLIVYYLCYVIFTNIELSLIVKGCNLLLIIFFCYSVFSILQLVIAPDTLVRSGRMSGFANPSYLSYIYILCFLFSVAEKKSLFPIWFAIVGFLTLTKTFFVAFSLVLVYLIIFSTYRFKLLVALFLLIPIMGYIIQLTPDVYIAFDKAVTVLTDRDTNEFNSLDDRFSRVDKFKEGNNGSFVFGYGTGRADPASVFLGEKLGKNLPNTVDFENQYLNVFYSLGVIGVVLFYYPFVANINRTLLSKKKIIEKHEIRLFYLVFLLYNVTLNIVESFTACIISLLFLAFYEKKCQNCD